MSRFQFKNAVRDLGIVFVALAGIFFLFPGSLMAQDPSGMSLKLLLLENRINYSMSDEAGIGMIGVIKNETGWSINTNVGIQEIELENYLIATDPCGEKHIAVRDIKAPADMPPSSTWGDLETVPAEVIQPGYERSVQIDDLRNLFPAMKKIPGEWKIQASITISRFLYTVNDQDGVRGVDDRAYHGTLKSNQLIIFVVPHDGGRLRVRVEDLSKSDTKAQAQVNVRVYRGSDIVGGNLTLADAWKKLEPLARGKTDQGGWVTLPDCLRTCLPRPDEGDNYTVIAEYKGKYKEAVFDFYAEGWAPNCGGHLKGYILFGVVPQEFSVFGLNSVWLRNNVRVVSGDVGAYDQCSSCIKTGI